MTDEKDSGSESGDRPERGSGGDRPQADERIGEEMGAHFKKALGLAAIVAGTGCMGKFDLSGRTFKVPYSKPPGEISALCPNWPTSKDRMSVAFADPLTFQHLNETVDASIFETYVMRDLNETCAGTYAIKATLRRGATGGPAGTSSELFVEESDRRFIGPRSSPKAPPGTRAILPGEIVIRPIREGELIQIEDRYMVELPANQKITIRFSPFRSEYEFKTTLKRSGLALSMENDPHSSGRYFHTTEAGAYELIIQHSGHAPREPDRYSFFVVWGVPLSVTGYLPSEEWRTFPETPHK